LYETNLNWQCKFRKMPTAWYLTPKQKLFTLLKSRRAGLSESEAKRRLRKYGPNVIGEEKRISPLEIFANQFKSFLIGLLFIAAAISFLIGHKIDSVVILAIVLMNAVIGFVQEYRAEKAMSALRKLAAPKAKVLRDGKIKIIPASEIVPGDIILLEAGDKVPADARLIECANLRVDESMLTGESVPVFKDVRDIKRKCPLAERVNCVFMDTIVVHGSGKAIVFSTGQNTEIGKIAKAIAQAETKETPIQKKMAEIAKWLGIGTIAICIAIFGLGLLRHIPILKMFLTSISLAVAAVPEGLPAIITITLAIGVGRMAKSNAIVRRLPAVETLGSCNVICTDKTGTLTKNQMTVQELYVNNLTIKITGEGYIPSGEFLIGNKKFDVKQDKHASLLLHAGALCNGADLYQEKGEWKIIGDPTEAALLVLTSKAGFDLKELRTRYRKIGELSFDARRKRMSTIHKHKNIRIAFVKGAPDSLLKCCKYILRDGKIIRLSKKEKEKIMKKADKMASRALRVLGVAYRELPKSVKHSIQEVERELVFLGLVGMADPLRPEARAAIRLCKQAGVKVVIVTGDHKHTALAIARELGLVSRKSRIMAGDELDEIDEKELQKKIHKIDLFARVTPEHKLKIVRAFQARGYVVAMTGDGVNDAPALKHADIGIAMGLAGTDVAKEAADMVLQDDNFATIVEAIKQGRGVFDNIKKSIAFLLSGNFGEIAIIFLAILANLPLPLLAIQILWINLVTDGLPALALSADPISDQVMKRKPRAPDESIFHGLRPYLLEYPAILCIGALITFWLTLSSQGLAYAQTAVFSAVVVFEMFQAFSCHSLYRPITKTKFRASKWLIIAALTAIILQITIVYFPLAQQVFHTRALSLFDWILIFGFSSLGLIYLELYKAFRK